MNEYEKHCAMIALELALTRAPSEMPATMWKYIRKIFIRLYKKNLIEYFKTKGPQFIFLNGNEWLRGFEAVDYIKKHFDLYENELMCDENFHKFVKYMKKWEDTPKYVFDINEALIQIGSSLYKCKKIIANKDIPTYDFYNGRQLIKKGAPGGCIESEKNLSHTGFCWIDENSCVLENARLEGNSFLISSKLYGNATVKGNNTIVYSTICQNASIEGSNSIQKSRIRGDSKIQDNSTIFESNIYDEVEIFGRNDIRFCNIFENIWIEDSELSYKNLKGNYKMKRKD